MSYRKPSYKKKSQKTQPKYVENLYDDIGLEIGGLYEFHGRFRVIYTNSETNQTFNNDITIPLGNNLFINSTRREKMHKHDLFMLLGHSLQYCNKQERTLVHEPIRLMIDSAILFHKKNNTPKTKKYWNMSYTDLRKIPINSIKWLIRKYYEEQQNEKVSVNLSMMEHVHARDPFKLSTHISCRQTFNSDNPLFTGRLYISFGEKFGWININRMSLVEIHKNFKLESPSGLSYEEKNQGAVQL